eukprot:10266826-Alexandrium_andersonii.AAC.1
MPAHRRWTRPKRPGHRRELSTPTHRRFRNQSRGTQQRTEQAWHSERSRRVCPLTSTIRGDPAPTFVAGLR